MSHRIFATFTMSLACMVLFAGCKEDPKPVAPQNQPKAATTQTATKPIIPHVHLNDWCPEHGVPESVCTRCNEELIPAFKKKGDWCEKHQLPDSQCLIDHPELKAKWEAMAPKKK